MKKINILYYLLFLFVNYNFAQERFDLYFDSNKFELSKIESKKLQDWISLNKEVKIVAINGYTDKDGSTTFNDTLAKNRVNYILNQIKNKVKIREDFKSRSFGENFNQNKDKAQNRKTSIYYILKKDLNKEEEILGIKPKIIVPIVPQEIIPIEEETMNFPLNASLEEKVKLSKKGSLIRLKDINFYVSTFAIMPSSRHSVDELVYVMNKYPKLKIEIQGHICCEKNDRKNLSLERARQIKRVLVADNVSEKRILVKGFGTTKPKFSIPEKNEAEAATNRRVEIMILENE